MTTIHFSHSKNFLQLLVPPKFFIFTFGPSFKVNSYIELIFFNKILHKNYNIKNLSQIKLEFFNKT